MDLMAARRRLMETQELPSAYRRVEYLETDGGQYLTGIQTTLSGNGLDFYCKYRLFDIKSYGPLIISTASTTFRFTNRTNGAVKSFFTINDTSYGYGVIAPLNEDIVASISNGYATIGNLGDPIQVGQTPSGTMAFGLLCFNNSPGTADYRAAMRIYGARLKCNEGTGINLIPCVRKSDSKPGMYDTVSKTFCTNAGIGEFIIPS